MVKFNIILMMHFMINIFCLSLLNRQKSNYKILRKIKNNVDYVVKIVNIWILINDTVRNNNNLIIIVIIGMYIKTIIVKKMTILVNIMKKMKVKWKKNNEIVINIIKNWYIYDKID